MFRERGKYPNDISTTKFYWEESHPFSLVVSKGHDYAPLPGESGPSTVCSVSSHLEQDAAEFGSMEVAGRDSEEDSTIETEESTDSESDVETS